MITMLYCILLVYVGCLFLLKVGYSQVKSSNSVKSEPLHKFSILIPFRNEEVHLPELLNSLNALNYPSDCFEVILINDASTDDSEAVIESFDASFNYRLIENFRRTNAPKKDAITLGVSLAIFDWIVTTDADCVVSAEWLRAINDAIYTFNPKMICGPVVYKKERRFLKDLQLMENLNLQFITRAAIGLGVPVMANGAHFAYSKKTFVDLKGFEGNDSIASGDDVFLMEKLRKSDPKAIVFLNDARAVVTTASANSWNELVNQRVRWASKTRNQRNGWAFLFGIGIALGNFAVIGAVLMSLISAENWIFYVAFVLVKILTDFMIFEQTSKFFERRLSILKFVVVNLCYSATFILILVLSISGKYEWKARRYVLNL